MPTDPIPFDSTYPGTDPIFVGSDPQEDPLLNNTDVNVGPTAPFSDQGLQSLAAWEVPEWDYTQSDQGFYVHSGRVYLVGSVTADGVSGSFPGSDVLLENIPAEYAPAGIATGRVLIDHVNSTYEYACDSGLKIGPWLEVTITPAGVMTLDGGNPVRPPTSDPYNNTYLSLIFSDISWPTDTAMYDAYGNTGSLDDFVATAAKISAILHESPSADVWTNVDGTYTAHGSRLHLNGKVQAGPGYPSTPDDDIEALIGIPQQYQLVLNSSDSSTVGEPGWGEFPQKDGYRLVTYYRHGTYRDLETDSGAQDPSSVGNQGCGFLAKYFYDRYSDGFLARGSDATLSFTPSTSDAGVSYLGCKGAPVGDLPAVADWLSNSYNVTLQASINDLISGMGSIDPPVTDYSAIGGDGQLSVIMGVEDGLDAPNSYYKVVFTCSTVTHGLFCWLFLEQCGGGRSLLASRSVSISYITDPAQPIIMNFELNTTTGPDFGVTPVPGWSYWDGVLLGWNYHGSDYVAHQIGGGDPIPPGKVKGNMGIHLPAGSAAKILNAQISGIGGWPVFAPGDVLDLTGCGWPIQ